MPQLDEELSVLAEGMPLVSFSHLLWPFGVAVLATALAGPIVRRIAVAHRLYDTPDEGLKPHEKPVPFFGGIAIYAGWLAAIALTIALRREAVAHLAWIAAGGTALFLVGLADDLRGLSPVLRLALQAGVAVVLVTVGIGRGAAPALMQPLDSVLPEFLQGETAGWALSAAFCAAVLAGATNATNLIDGLDGLCAGIIAVSAGGFLIVHTILADAVAISPEETLMFAVLCAGSLGACAAFLRINFNPASMFMGDSGALLLGYVVSMLIISLAEHASWRGLVVGVLVFGFPVFDTALALGRRWLNGKPLFVGDRSHFYDQIADRGWSVRKTVVICYALGIAFTALAVLVAFLPSRFLIPACLAIPIGGAFLCWRYGMLRVDDAAARSERK